MLQTAFDLHAANWPGVLLAVVPLLLNAWILVYSQRHLPRDHLTVVFQLYVVALMTWQAYDACVRLSATAATAEIWRGYLRAGQLFCVPLGLHFAALYAERDQLANTWWFWGLLYASPALMLGGFQAGLIDEELHYAPGWGMAGAQP